MHQFDLPRPTPLSGQVLDDLLQPPAVGNGPVQEPQGLACAESGQGLPDEFQGGLRFVNLAIAAMHAGHVAHCPVASQEEHAAGERRLDRRQHVVAVDLDPAAGQGRRQNQPLLPPRDVGIAARGSRYGQPLPRFQGMPIAHQLEARQVRVTARQEPGEFHGRRFQCRQGLRSKEPKIVGMRAAMPALVGHRSRSMVVGWCRAQRRPTNNIKERWVFAALDTTLPPIRSDQFECRARNGDCHRIASLGYNVVIGAATASGQQS